MRNVFLLLAAGTTTGFAIGVWLPIPGEFGCLRSTIGGAITFGAFGLGGILFGLVFGRALGWGIGGVAAITPAWTLWMMSIAPRHIPPNRVAAVSIFIGIVAGAICGPLLGILTLRREADECNPIPIMRTIKCLHFLLLPYPFILYGSAIAWLSVGWVGVIPIFGAVWVVLASRAFACVETDKLFKAGQVGASRGKIEPRLLVLTIIAAIGDLGLFGLLLLIYPSRYLE